VGFRKITIITPQKTTVQKHNPLRYEKEWPPRVDPGGHNYVVLNVSINNTPVFVSAVVINGKISLS